ncbi:hypothetical protein RFI_20552 [Reticulomyxa filosa]|uniref:Uncharacterized protein n=1 Tax=Reticulomyxa filosa TaxID=46433 RepID=X6MSF9_RETFI|nr:hypothetical protein RFI_20552 [Reticulomyxa filosa]|eukprot:ETO16784.1 hypothetical protein RFI_20552 [Reticulomyxa filosa]
MSNTVPQRVLSEIEKSTNSCIHRLRERHLLRMISLPQPNRDRAENDAIIQDVKMHISNHIAEWKSDDNDGDGHMPCLLHLKLLFAAWHHLKSNAAKNSNVVHYLNEREKCISNLERVFNEIESTFNSFLWTQFPSHRPVNTAHDNYKSVSSSLPQIFVYSPILPFTQFDHQMELTLQTILNKVDFVIYYT